MQGWREKYRSPPGRGWFFHATRRAWPCLYERTRVTFACELRELGYGTDVILDLDYFWNHREDYTRKIPVFRGKTLSLQKDKELFDSMRNIVILNSLHFSYPLPILMRVSYNTLIVKQNTSDYYKYTDRLQPKREAVGYSSPFWEYTNRVLPV